MSYKLVNPYIKGDFDSTFKASTPLKAADKCWTELSQYFTNNVPKFAFTLERTTDGKFFHFSINEKQTGSSVDYKIAEIKMKEQDEKILRNKLDNMESGEMSGGKHKHKDDDDSSSEYGMYSFYNHLRNFHNYGMPFYYFWYSPLPYTYDTCFIPTFRVPIVPYIEIQTASWIIT